MAGLGLELARARAAIALLPSGGFERCLVARLGVALLGLEFGRELLRRQFLGLFLCRPARGGFAQRAFFRRGFYLNFGLGFSSRFLCRSGFFLAATLDFTAFLCFAIVLACRWLMPKNLKL